MVKNFWKSNGDFSSYPRSQTHGKSVNETESRALLDPQGLKVDVEADATSSVHLGGLVLEKGHKDVGRSVGIRGRQLDGELKLVLLVALEGPARAAPFQPFGVICLEPEPVRLRIFRSLDVGDQCRVLFLESSFPSCIQWSSSVDKSW